MPGLPDISLRRLEPELMDDPALDAGEHHAALAGLRWVNRLSLTARQLWAPIARLASCPGHPPVSVLDVATGSGDIPVALAALAARAGIAASFAGCDVSQRALDVARGRARDATFFRLDAIRDPIPGDYDVVTACLFTHHLKDDEVVTLLYKMRAAARRLVLVSDLRRCRPGLMLAWATTRLSRSAVVRTDAVLSVRAAFTMQEFGELAAEAGMEGATIRPCWPCRFMLEWRRR